jgi:hypothetical protein
MGAYGVSVSFDCTCLVNAEFNQIGMGDGQVAVIFSAVGCEFDLNAIKDAASGETQSPHGRRSKHLNGARRELPIDRVRRSVLAPIHAAPPTLA